MRHKIYINNKISDKPARLDPLLIRRVVKSALDAENVDVPCEISVLITNDFEIQAINREYRGIDAPTDVLSFPLCVFAPGEFSAADGETDMSSGLLPLGDIVLCAPQVDRQAAEFGQTRERETAYLVIHSVLHLLGYDHLDEGEQKKQMRAREKEILKESGYTANVSEPPRSGVNIERSVIFRRRALPDEDEK
ncbi:MAG: rRNA maturation RNase YbeY [Oscillospiraceae bacterium]|jgi:probable rRNA maturation factor|nr:rRNA maturation RNase YbeY [Oscillospiraceae bacterium]